MKTKTQISTFEKLDLKLDSWSHLYVELELEPFFKKNIGIRAHD